MEVGRHELSFEVPFTLSVGSNGPVLAAWTETHSVTLELVDPGGDPVVMRKDEVAGAALSAALSLSDSRIKVTQHGSDAWVNLSSVPASYCLPDHVAPGRSGVAVRFNRDGCEIGRVLVRNGG